MLQCIPGSHPTGAAVPLGGTQKMRSVWAQRQKCCVLPFSPCAAPQGCSSLPWSSPTLARVGCSAPPTCCRKATHPRRLESELCSARGAGAAGAPWQGSALLHPRLRAALGRRGRLHLPPPAPQRRDRCGAAAQMGHAFWVSLYNAYWMQPPNTFTEQRSYGKPFFHCPGWLPAARTHARAPCLRWSPISTPLAVG